MSYLVDMFAPGTYLAITCEVEVAFGCVLAYICKPAGSICSFSMLAISGIFGMWQSYLFSNICQICVQCSMLMAGASDVICGICMHPIYRHVKYLAYMADMPYLYGIFVSDTDLAITCEVKGSCFGIYMVDVNALV